MSRNKDRNKCFYCTSYDMWCGICLNPDSQSFKDSREAIADDEACEHYEFNTDSV